MTTKGDVTIALVGDMFISRPDPASIFAHAADLLRKADITAGNLEGAITDAGEETRAKQATTMFSSEAAVDAYVHAGFDVVSLANNHTMNRGEAGLLRSIEIAQLLPELVMSRQAVLYRRFGQDPGEFQDHRPQYRRPHW